MTTVEFKKELEDLGYDWEYEHGGILEIYKNGVYVARIETNTFGDFRFNFYTTGIKGKEAKEIIDLMTEYVLTPIADRVGEERFHWRVKGWGKHTCRRRISLYNRL